MAPPGARANPRGQRPADGEFSGTLLAFDFGVRRIGVAVGETATKLAHPIAVIESEVTRERFLAIGKLVREWRPAGFVVGRPRHADGAEHPVAKLAEKFARRLTARFDLPAAFVDETLTSAVAESQRREAQGRARQRADIDALAAALILQSYLDAYSAPPESQIASRLR